MKFFSCLIQASEERKNLEILKLKLLSVERQIKEIEDSIEENEFEQFKMKNLVEEKQFLINGIEESEHRLFLKNHNRLVKLGKN